MNIDALWPSCIALAQRAVGVSDPNPRVGCLIIGREGQVLGEGSTQAAGDAHAEVMALRDAAERGHDTQGATALVSLEPCSHQGRTPPCTGALIAAGISTVVVAIEDPNPLVAGQGLAQLAAAGVTVTLVGGAFAQASKELNIGFFSRMVRQRPWLRMKMAASLDGRTALPNGQSQWITGEAARTDGHAWRRRAGAVLTGIGTVNEDNPRLDVRWVQTARQPLRVVVDSQLQIKSDASILAAPGEALIYMATPPETDAGEATRRRADALCLGREHISVSPLPADAQGKTDLQAMVKDLAQRGVNELHVEAGEKLNASLLRAGLVDELLLYVAPRLLGTGRGLADLGTLPSLDESLNFQWHEVTPIGRDLRLLLRRQPTMST